MLKILRALDISPQRVSQAHKAQELLQGPPWERGAEAGGAAIISVAHRSSVKISTANNAREAQAHTMRAEGTRPLASCPGEVGPSPVSAPAPSDPKQVTEPGHLSPKRTTTNL